MIKDGDRIAVGISGGKDSLCLLVLLNKLKDFYPEKFEIEAVYISMDTKDNNIKHIEKFCREINVNFTCEETLIGKIVFDAREEKNPCSLCSNMKRGALHNVAKKLNCNKVALGHHCDDVIEAFIMSIFYEGRIHTFSPVTYLGRKKLYLIRPMIYIKEKTIRDFVKRAKIETVKSQCVYDGKSKRQYIKELILYLSRENRKIDSNIFGAIKRSKIDGW